MNLIRNLSSLVYEPVERPLFLIGARNSGKTTFLYRLKLGLAIDTIPTFGVNVESLEYNTKSFLIHDIGDGLDHQTRPILRRHLDPQSFVFFLHDCSHCGNIVESTKVLHENVKDLLDSGTRFLWIVLNKLDVGEVAETRNAVRLAKRHFEHEMEQYDGRLIWKIMALDGLSGRTGNRVFDVIDDMWPTFKAHRNFAPASESTKPGDLEIYDTCQGRRVYSLRELEGPYSDLDSNAFWRAFQDGTVTSWTHRDRLRAAYMVMLEAIENDQGILELPGPFRLREDAIHGNHSPWNRTLAVFWFYQLQMVIFKHKNFKRGKWPLPDDFDDILSQNRHLSNRDLCQGYYSEALVLSPRAEKYYCLPDLKDLPHSGHSSISPKVRWCLRSPTSTHSERLPRFAFAIVRTYLTTPALDRSWIIKQALSALQSTTMRIRACPRGNTLAPYSETKTYFWISRVHALLSSAVSKLDLDTTSEKSTGVGSILNQLTFDGFKSMVTLNCLDWKEHYSPMVWDSVAARGTIVSPDIKPLYKASDFPMFMTLKQVLQAQEKNRKFGLCPELPSDEELAFRLSLYLNQAGVPSQSKCPVRSHAHMLMDLFEQLVDHPNLHASGRKCVHEVVPMIHGSADAEQDSHMFWAERVREALLAPNAKVDAERNGNLAFETFLRENIHLAYDGLLGTSEGLTEVSVHFDEKVEPSVANTNLEESEKSMAMLVIEKLDESVIQDADDAENGGGIDIESWEVVCPDNL